MGIDKWKLFDWAWQTEDDDAVVTDATEANDSVVEQAILDFQRISKELTDMLVALSTTNNDNYDLLQKVRDSVTIAYEHALNEDIDSVKRELSKVLEL